MRHQRELQPCGVCKHSCTCRTDFYQRTIIERMRRQHTDVWLHLGSRSHELSVDRTHQRYDCIGTGYTNSNGFVCFELRCERYVEREVAELLWLEYCAHTYGV